MCYMITYIHIYIYIYIHTYNRGRARQDRGGLAHEGAGTYA